MHQLLGWEPHYYKIGMGRFFPVAYGTRKLLDRERRYSVIDRECLGIVWGIKKFAMYLCGKSFILQTDHRPYSSQVLQNLRVLILCDRLWLYKVLTSMWNISKRRDMSVLIFLAGQLSKKFYCVAFGTVLATEVTEILLTIE